jgi:hypothetical protein
MQVDSYLEIFTTMYGWAFANIIGEVLTGTGLVALPFALIVFNAWREAREAGTGGESILGVIDAVTTRLITAMFVFATCFAVTPFTSLASMDLRYRPEATAANPSPSTVSLNSGTGSTYDTALNDVRAGTMSTSRNLSYVPAWWMTVMALSSGLNNAVRDGLTHASSEIRMVEDMARTATIEDAHLLSEIQRFYSECFVPARSRYLAMDRADLSATGVGILASGNADYGPGDVDWIGSQLFRTEPGFYGAMRSYHPVPGFPVVPSRDTDYIAGGAPGTPEQDYVNPVWGRPTCLEWWMSEPSGIRERMINHSSTWQQLLTGITNTMSFTSGDKAKDSLAQLAQTRANPQFVDSARIMGNDYDGMTSLVRGVGGAVSTLGVAKKLLVANIEFVPLVNGLPMVQAMVLMGMYMFLPLVVLLSGYDLKMLLVGGIAIFTVKFWSVMWFVARWIDAHLIEAMYPGLNGNLLMQEVNAIVSGGEAAGYKRMLLNLVMMSMFVGLPLVWTGLMTAVGYRTASSLGGSFRTATQVSSGSTPNIRRPWRGP